MYLNFHPNRSFSDKERFFAGGYLGVKVYTKLSPCQSLGSLGRKSLSAKFFGSLTIARRGLKKGESMEYLVENCQVCKMSTLHGKVGDELESVSICCECAVRHKHDQEQAKEVLIPGPFGDPRPLEQYTGCLE